MKFRELDVVQLITAVDTFDGTSVPVGTTGTIVDHPKRSRFYCVEFGDYTSDTPLVYGEADVTANMIRLVQRPRIPANLTLRK